MPVLKNRESKFDIDGISRDVVTMGLKMVTRGFETGFHRHRKAQCLMAVSGVLTCEIEGGICIVPPQAALWIPPGVEHSITFAGKIEGYNAFVEPTAARNLPSTCCTICVSPLLRELLIRTAQHQLAIADGGMESRVASLLLEEIGLSELGQLHLPMPKDKRLRKIFQSLMSNPVDRGTMASWARRCAMSVRTLARLIVAETGMSFGRWRQQLNIIQAVEWMAKGTLVQQVAHDLGYESVGSFVTMFRKVMGTSPGRYMASRKS